MKISQELENKARLLIFKNKKIEAVKIIKEGANIGLKEAKDYVDALTVTAKSNRILEDYNVLIKSLLSEGRKLEAVKVYKENTESSLEESKDYIDNFRLDETNSADKNNNLNRETSIENILINQHLKSAKTTGALKIFLTTILIALIIYGLYNYFIA